jgi:hypothetical protein
MEAELMRRLAEADENSHLVFGISNVWEEAIHHNGLLLVVEKDYRYTGISDRKKNAIRQPIAPFARYSI